MNKKLSITIPVLIAVIIAVILTTIMMNNNQGTNPAGGAGDESSMEEIMLDKIYVSVGDEKKELVLKENSSVSALLKMLPIELNMTDLNGNEKYAYLDEALPTDSYAPRQIEAGDVMLYDNNCLVIFYKSIETDYEYSKIGHIDNLPELGGEDVVVRFSVD